jgi:hypothetical protein
MTKRKNQGDQQELLTLPLTPEPQHLQPAKTTPVSVTDLISQAIDKGLDVSVLEKLMDLKERYDANEARKRFYEAFTLFQANCPDLRKTKEVKFETRTGGATSYHYAPLSDITRQISKILERCKLSYRWKIQDDNNILKVTCQVSHIDGHTEETSMQASPDTSGSKNSIQARGSAIEYLKRYTLIGALGLSTADSDVDGRLPEVDVDAKHKEFMEVYNQVIQLDPELSKWHPDNWKVEPTAPVYVKAIGNLRKVLFDLQQKNQA